MSPDRPDASLSSEPTLDKEDVKLTLVGLRMADVLAGDIYQKRYQGLGDTPSRRPDAILFQQTLAAYRAESARYFKDLSTYDPSTAFLKGTFGFHILQHATKDPEFTREMISDLPLIFAKPADGTQWPSPEDNDFLININRHIFSITYGLRRFLQKISIQGFVNQARATFVDLLILQRMGKLRGCSPVPETDLNDEEVKSRASLLSVMNHVEGVYVQEPDVYLLFYNAAISLLKRTNPSLHVEITQITQAPVREKIRQLFLAELRKNISLPQGQFVLDYMDSLFRVVNQVLGEFVPPAVPSVTAQAALSSPDPSTPRKLPEAPVPPMDIDRLRNFAQSYYSPGGRRDERWLKKTETEASEARTACLNKASVVPEPLNAEVSLGKRTDCEAIVGLRLVRHTGHSPDGSNLACTAGFRLRSGRAMYSLRIDMDGEGRLTLFLSNQILKEVELSSPSFKNLIPALRRLILLGLQDHLVRRTTDRERLHLPQTGSLPPSASLGEATEEPPVRLEDLSIHPRSVQDMFVVEARKGPSEELVQQGPRLPSGTAQLLTLINKTSPIEPGDLAGVSCPLFQREIIDIPSKKELSIYVPVDPSDRLKILEEVRTGALGREHVFLELQRGSVQRSGYHPWRRGGEPGVLHLTQRLPDQAKQEALLAHLEKRLGGRVERANKGLNFTILSTRGDISKVLIHISSSDGTEALRDIPLLVEDIHLLTQGYRFEDGLSDGAALVDMERGISSKSVTNEQGETAYQASAVLRVPQTLAFNQGSYLSLAKAASFAESASR